MRIPVSDTLTVGLVLIAYVVAVPQDVEIRMSHEHTAIDWVTMSEAAERLSYKYPPEFTRLLVG